VAGQVKCPFCTIHNLLLTPVACTFPRCDSTSDQLGTFLCRIFAVFDPRSAVPWYLASVGTILDLLLHIYFLYSQPQTQRYREEFPGLRSQWGSVQPIPCVLQHSALACVFSNSSIIYSKQRRTILRSLAWRGSVRDPLRCQIPSSWSGSPVALLSMPHLRASPTTMDICTRLHATRKPAQLVAATRTP